MPRINTHLWNLEALRTLSAGQQRTRAEGRKQTVAGKHRLPHLRQTGNGNVLCDAGNSNLGSVTTWGCERVGGGKSFRREGTYIYLWLIHVDVWQK